MADSWSARLGNHLHNIYIYIYAKSCTGVKFIAKVWLAYMALEKTKGNMCNGETRSDYDVKLMLVLRIT